MSNQEHGLEELLTLFLFLTDLLETDGLKEYGLLWNMKSGLVNNKSFQITYN